jgi:hypothetical protein
LYKWACSFGQDGQFHGSLIQSSDCWFNVEKHKTLLKYICHQ